MLPLIFVGFSINRGVIASCVSRFIKQDILSHQRSGGLFRAQIENSENIEIYFHCESLASDDELVGEMALSMPENYTVLSNYCTVPKELLMSHMGDTNQGLMDETETKTIFDAKCM